MKTLLFVNACMRGQEKSRTYELSKSFLQALEGKYTIETVDLNELDLHYLNAKRVEFRDDLIAQNKLQHHEFALARQFAAADRIVIAAPFWDLSVPAALKVYIENIAVLNIVFKYGENGVLRGLCKAEKLFFITTCGGNIQDGILQKFEMATPYLRGLCTMFGIKDFDYLLTDGLDIYGADVHSILSASKFELERKAEVF